jgi:hypothetical protein
MASSSSSSSAPPPASATKTGGGEAPSAPATPMVLFEQSAQRKRKGTLGKSKTKHHEEVFEEDEAERESTDFVGGFAVSRNEMMFDKWIKNNLDTDAVDFSDIEQLKITPKKGKYIPPEKKKMLEIYFKMCHLSSQASSDPYNYAEKYELLCRRYDANTPYDLLR